MIQISPQVKPTIIKLIQKANLEFPILLAQKQTELASVSPSNTVLIQQLTEEIAKINEGVTAINLLQASINN